MVAKASQCRTVLLGLSGVSPDRCSADVEVAVKVRPRARKVGHEEAVEEEHRLSEGRASSVVDHPPHQTKVVHAARWQMALPERDRLDWQW